MTAQRRAPDFYTMPATWHLVMHAYPNTQPFEIIDDAAECVRLLLERSVATQVSVLAYCIMPDHVHVLVDNAGGQDIARFVRQFKQVVGYAFKQRNGYSPWQKSFYDRALYTEEEIEVVRRYIVQNPVKDGLAQHEGEYKFAADLIRGSSQAKPPELM